MEEGGTCIVPPPENDIPDVCRRPYPNPKPHPNPNPNPKPKR